MTPTLTPTATTPPEAALPSLADHIVKTPGTCGGKARLNGTRIRVQDVYVWHELQGRSVDEIVASYPQLTHAQVHAALSYFFSRSDEIRQEMEADERAVEELKTKTGPGPLAEKLARRSQHVPNVQVPS